MLDKALPFFSQFYSELSQYFWTDDCGDTHVIHQGEGGEQGDALMPMLYALGQHGALLSLQDFLLPQRTHFSPLQTTSTWYVCQIAWVRFSSIFRRLLISMPAFKFTWNRGGHYPLACQQMQEAAARAGEVRDPLHNKVFVCWASQSAMRSLFRPSFGTEKHQTLVERIPLVQDLQSAWASRKLRQSSLQPHMIYTWQCFTRLLGISGRSDEIHAVCHSIWVGADCGPPPGRGSLLIGPAGLTVSG